MNPGKRHQPLCGNKADEAHKGRGDVVLGEQLAS